MKTSEIAAVMECNNPKLHIGGVELFMPVLPLSSSSRRKIEVGWVAFNLIRCLELEHKVSTNDRPERRLWVNRTTCTFALMPANYIPTTTTQWEEVEFDGYGGLETWKEFVQ